jgi:hypothetical protein
MAIDPGEESIRQIAQAIDYLVFNQTKRILMEKHLFDTKRI